MLSVIIISLWAALQLLLILFILFDLFHLTIGENNTYFLKYSFKEWITYGVRQLQRTHAALVSQSESVPVP